MSSSSHIVCPHCSSVNRVSVQRLSENPICGQCKQALFNGHPAELTANSFSQHISRNDIPVLVDFWAQWCGPCKTMIPIFKHAAEQLEPHVRLVKVDTEQEHTLAGQYNIRSIPTLVLFKEGKEIARQAGVVDAEDIVGWVGSQL
ncbi:MAG: thioredoxin TrxC [Methylophaga sp.]|nr:thioredoxin TrxC [Methylophaga sp.]